MKRRTFAAWPLWALASGAGLVPELAAAQANYPSKPLKFIVPYAAGGLPDTVARVVAQRLGERLGQAVIVDNRAGGGTVIAGQAEAQAAPDGYTLSLATTGQLAINPALHARLVAAAFSQRSSATAAGSWRRALVAAGTGAAGAPPVASAQLLQAKTGASVDKIVYRRVYRAAPARGRLRRAR